MKHPVNRQDYLGATFCVVTIVVLVAAMVTARIIIVQFGGG